jgi:orotidine-5'-phosphate decarboxylase
VPDPKSHLCFALDVDDDVAALALVDELRDQVGVFKIGLELFIATGPALVRAVRARGVEVFLDLKQLIGFVRVLPLFQEHLKVRVL